MFYQSHKLIKLQFKTLGKLKLDANIESWEESFWVEHEKELVWLWWVCGLAIKNACNAGDMNLILGSGRSLREGYSNPLQYSCMKNSMDREAWPATVYGVPKELDMT